MGSHEPFCPDWHVSHNLPDLNLLYSWGDRCMPLYPAICWDGVSQNLCLGCPHIAILPLSATDEKMDFYYVLCEKSYIFCLLILKMIIKLKFTLSFSPVLKMPFYNYLNMSQTPWCTNCDLIFQLSKHKLWDNLIIAGAFLPCVWCKHRRST
jgi:hypothetical protein